MALTGWEMGFGMVFNPILGNGLELYFSCAHVYLYFAGATHSSPA